MQPGLPSYPYVFGYLFPQKKAGADYVGLDDYIEKFEKMHGPIKHIEPAQGPIMPMNFGGPAGQA